MTGLFNVSGLEVENGDNKIIKFSIRGNDKEFIKKSGKLSKSGKSKSKKLAKSEKKSSKIAIYLILALRRQNQAF